ncbi:unnamed protein product [Blepharisma stoltei]|uniref:PiggyBac transposable element-derived protein domain-containing protein n=1 Tax=Blepharisma stoltei TaxID=1481888 RepID=A0AAU9IDT8_9CILI|nr:unnamed protein product [Blepharisma stoltei]
MENDLIEVISSESSEGTSSSEEEIKETNYSNEFFEDGNDWIEIAEYGREDTIPPMDPYPNISQFTTISPLDIFRGFFEDNIMNEIIKNSNFIAEKMRAKPNPWYKIKDLTPLTKLEFENWLAVIIMTGLVSTPKETDYWSKDPLFRNPVISSIMSSSRYKGIQLMLRLSSTHFKDGINKLEPVYKI